MGFNSAFKGLIKWKSNLSDGRECCGKRSERVELFVLRDCYASSGSSLNILKEHSLALVAAHFSSLLDTS